MLLTIGQLSFAQDLLWAKVLNNTSLVDVFAEETRSIVCDASGNIYITGYFEGTVDFDPGPGVQNLQVRVDLIFFLLSMMRQAIMYLPKLWEISAKMILVIQWC